MNCIWNEERVREVIRELDKRTGLTGAALPISFNNAKCTLGQFYFDENKISGFKFSNWYYQDPNWPEEVAIATIKHEYAHYMDYEIYGNIGHGMTWKACCGKIGVAAVRLYHDSEAEYYRHKHQVERDKSAKLDGYVSGMHIKHPKYGEGIIKEVLGKGTSRQVTVEFSANSVKTLSLEWIHEKCETYKGIPPFER